MGVAKLLVTYVLTLVVFAALDYAWVGVVMRERYQRYIGHLLAQRFNVRAIIAFYLIFTLGLSFFAVSPGFIKGSFVAAFVLGALFGFFTYATYNLTNMATLRGWPLRMTLLDMTWGTVMPGVVAMAGLFIAQALV